MLEKSPVHRISILRSMAEHGEENEPKLIVPQNSVMNIRLKMGLSEATSNSQVQAPGMKSKASEQSIVQCAHCENMAKNFIYLESLLRTNYDANKPCSLCYSAIKYLEYVNRSITDIFGNLDGVAKEIGNLTTTQKKSKATRKAGKVKTFPQLAKSKGDKVKSVQKGDIKRQEGGGIVSQQNFPRARVGSLTKTITKKARTSSSLKSQTKPKKTKLTKKSTASAHSGEVSKENRNKVKRNKKKPKTTKVIILKQKCAQIRPKPKKVAKNAPA